MKKKYVLSLFALMAIFYGYSRIYMAPSFSGVVEDAATGKPVVGAVVVATWHSQSPGFHSLNNQLFYVQETVTDAEGRFFIKGWRLRVLFRLLGYIPMDQPTLLVSKYGYEPIKLWNHFPPDKPPQSRHGITVEWNVKKTIYIQPLVENKSEKFMPF